MTALGPARSAAPASWRLQLAPRAEDREFGFRGFGALADRLRAGSADGPELWITDCPERGAEAQRQGAVALLVTTAFAAVPNDVEVVRSETHFLRDLTLDDLLRGVTAIAPDLVADRHRHADLADLLAGSCAHIGHAGDKVVERAVGLDLFRRDHRDLVADPRDLWCCDRGQLDSALVTLEWEKVLEPRQVLAEAARIVADGGRLVLAGRGREPLPPDLAALANGVALHEVRPGVLAGTVRARAVAGGGGQVVPAVSVLILGEVHEPDGIEAPRLGATIEAAHASLGDLPHEIVVLLRHRPEPDALAALRELARRIPACRLDEALAPLPLPARLERLRRAARAPHLLVLASGALPAGGALRQLVAAAGDAALAVPSLTDPSGFALAAEHAPGACVLVAAEAWPEGALDGSPFLTHELWNEWAERVPPRRVPEARVITDGWAGRGLCGSGPAALRFDASLRGRARPTECERILVVCLRTMGDCILATAPIAALAERRPDAVITVLTERRYGWVFRWQAAVDEVLVTGELSEAELFWQEQELIAHVLAGRAFDRLVVLSDRLDNVPYFRAGVAFSEFYAVQAGVPEAALWSYPLALPATAVERARGVLATRGVRGGYAAVHTRAGWPERTPPAALFEQLCGELAERHGLTPVVVGGAGEEVASRHAVNLAGHVPVEVSAAVIAQARVFVGPDSGSMHMASAFGVPTLGLYGGTSLRLVPPRTHHAVTVQSPTSCPRPCGLSPCRYDGCGAQGLRLEHVQEPLAALLEAAPGPREWLGGQPAVVVAAPDGWAVQQTRAGPLSRPVPAPISVRLGSVARREPAPVIEADWSHRVDRGLEYQRWLLALRTAGYGQGVPETGGFGDLDAAALHGLALARLQRGDGAGAVHALERAVAAAAHGPDGDAEAERRRRRVVRALRRTLGTFSWPDELRRRLPADDA